MEENIMKQISELSEKAHRYDKLMEKMTTMQNIMQDIREELNKIDEFINPLKNIRPVRTRGADSPNYEEKILRIIEELKIGKQLTKKDIGKMYPELSDTQLGTLCYEYLPKVNGLQKHRREGCLWYFM